MSGKAGSYVGWNAKLPAYTATKNATGIKRDTNIGNLSGTLKWSKLYTRLDDSFYGYGISGDIYLPTARRGVRIEVIAPGKKIDSATARRASRGSWGELLQEDIRIYEFQPSMYHCKFMIVDEIWTSVGSTNFDNRSFRLNDECNLNILDEDFAKERMKVFANDRARSKEITFEAWKSRPLLEKGIEKVAAIFATQT